MRCFVKTENNKPITGRIIEDNMKMLFPDLDLNGKLPEGFAELVIENQLPDTPIRTWYDTDFFYDSEKNIMYEKQLYKTVSLEEKQAIIDEFINKPGSKPFDSWIFDENLFRFIPPVDVPNDGKRYIWNELNKNWKEV